MHRHEEPYSSLHEVLGFYPDNIELYRQALIHKSLTMYRRGGNNERMEFLGDAVLSAVVTDFLYENCEGKPEGFLSEMRSKIVQRETLDRVAAELDIGRLMFYSKRSNKNGKHIFGNALEALIGAVYLDQGYGVCYDFVKREILHKHINLHELEREKTNHKSKLLEWGQKNKIEFRFEVVVCRNNIKRGGAFFRSVVVLGGEQIGDGTGVTKKESEQKAAMNVLGKIHSNKTFRGHIIELGKQTESNAGDLADETSCEPPCNPE